MSRRTRCFLVLLCVIGTVAPASVGKAAPPECQQVLLVFARGSGQGLNAVNATTFFNNVKANMTSGVLRESVEVGDLDRDGTVDPGDYPAVGHKDWLGFERWGVMAGYNASRRAGTDELVDFLNHRASTCVDETVILGGYSQGAHVVGDTLFRLTPSAAANVGFVALFGDPKFNLGSVWRPFKNDAPWVRGNVSWWADGGILGPRHPYVPESFRTRVGSWCDKQDPICTGNLGRLGDGAHSEYPQSEVFEAANEIAVRLRDIRPAQSSSFVPIPIPVSVQPNSKVDLVFVFDTTGSMGRHLASAKNAAASLTDTMFGLSTNTQVGLVEFRDHGDFFVARTNQLLTTDRSAFIAALNGLSAGGGGDTPEAVYSGLMRAFDSQPWRDGATKIAILIGDAPAKDPEPVTGYTLESVARRAFEIDPVNVYPILTGDNAGASVSFSAIAESTDGLLFAIGEDLSLAQALAGALDEIALEPVANAGGPYTAAPGDEILFTGAASLDPDSRIAEWAWDFENDGVFDEVGPSPVVIHSYGSSYSGWAVLRVTSADGGTSTATVQVDVAPGLALPPAPAPPRGVVATKGAEPGEAVLTWEAPAGPSPDGYRVTREDGSVVALAVGDTRSVVIGGLDTETEVRFAVEASNEFGFSSPAVSNTLLLTANRPPSCTNVRPTPALIWPPNQRLVRVTLAGATDPDPGDAAHVAVTGVAQDEATGDEADARLDAASSDSVAVRAQREGGGDGRIYLISFSATDMHGASCSGDVGVIVPHDRKRKSKLVEAGDMFDSLVASS